MTVAHAADAAPSHAVLHYGYLNPRAGGAAGYLWNLRAGLIRIGQEHRVLFSVLTSDEPTKTSVRQRLAKNLRSLVKRAIQRVPIVAAYFEFWTEWQRLKHCTDLRWIARTHPLIDTLDLRRICTLHVHDTVQLVQAHHALEVRGCRSRIKLVLTSHPPELPGIERAAEFRDRGIFSWLVNRFEARHVHIDRLAFTIADALVFPSKEATEPYLGHVGQTIASKEVRYVLTGVPPAHVAEPISAGLKDSLDGKFVVCYLGRHNRIKGYDLLMGAAERLLERHDDIAFLIAGAIGSSQPLKHPRWIEVGWTASPEALVSRCDVFVLPNRTTFFDLVLLEVMSLGKPVIASRTGGNKTVAAISNGMILFDGSLDDLTAKIDYFKRLPEADQKQYGKANQGAYFDKFTIETFARGYLNVVGELGDAASVNHGASGLGVN